MTRMLLLRILGWIWAAFGVYWIAAAGRRIPERTSELPLYRLLRISILAVTFTLLFAKWSVTDALGRNFLPERPLLAYAGFCLAVLGIAIAFWARVHLGPFWSDKVVLKVDHKLIRTGPYARLRHPIYSGVLLGVSGTALVLDQWRGVLAFIILLTNYWIKAKREEQILQGAFADSFAEYKNRAGFLLPNLGRHS